ncbi:MAG TPA: hypothetical protein VFF06_25370 [Polyangia bacterium]|nr:hypothetical protein [Polyangia bacterium]
MKTTHAILFSTLALAALAGPARADELQFYGTVESFAGGALVVKTTKGSTGHWRVDGTTKVTGAVAAADWVFVDVETSGHVKTLKVEEQPTSHTGVIKAVEREVLDVASGKTVEKWNLTPTTIFEGVARAAVKPGDEIAVKVYKNHNIAELRVLKSGVK